MPNITLHKHDQELVDLAVERGAHWCDERFPGWAEWIDTETLDISNPSHCTGAQIAKHEGLTPTPWTEFYGAFVQSYLDDDEDITSDLGFYLPTDDHGYPITSPSGKAVYDALTAKWVEVIQARRS